MKKILTICASAFLAIACSTAPSYKISGNIEGLADGPLYLQVMEGKIPRGVDTISAQGGTFVFEGAVELPMLAQISTPEGSVTSFFLENAPMTITGKWDQKDSIIVAGSATNDLYNQYSDKISAAASYDEAHAINTDFVTTNPTSVAAAYVLFRRMSPSMEFNEIREKVSAFDSTIQKSIYLVLANDMADKMEKVAIGKPFVDFTLPDTTGAMVALSSIAGKGNCVLLDFWASWCGPCRVENPHVVAAYNEFSPLGFTVFGVSLDRPDGRDRWIAAIEKDKLAWTNVSDLKGWECEPAASYGVRSIPSNVLIGPDGTIVARNLRGVELKAKLKELLGEKAAK